MKTMVLATVSAVTLLASMGAYADPPAPTVVPGGVRPGEPLICQYTFHEGNLVSRQTCKTQREWNRDRIERQADVRHLQLRALSSFH